MTPKRIPLSRSATSQKAVFQYLKENPESSAQEIGDALWSPCNAHAITKRNPKTVRREWAGKILGILKEKGLANYQHKNHPRWSVIPAPVTPQQEPQCTHDHSKTTNEFSMDQFRELFNFLTGKKIPEGLIISSVHKPNLTPKRAFSVIWFLQVHLGILPERCEMCCSCGSLYDPDHQGGWHNERAYCDPCHPMTYARIDTRNEQRRQKRKNKSAHANTTSG